MATISISLELMNMLKNTTHGLVVMLNKGLLKVVKDARTHLRLCQ